MTRVKICGITSLEDARLAAELGAWALGLIFWPESPRACPPDGGRGDRRRDAPPGRGGGVFVNATLDEVALAADRFSLTLLQLHGDEGPAYCREAARRTGCRVIKAARVQDAASVRGSAPSTPTSTCSTPTCRAAAAARGRRFNWELAGPPDAPPLVLSGGLDAGQRRRGDRRGRALARRHRQRHRGAPGRQGPGAGGGLLPRRRGGRPRAGRGVSTSGAGSARAASATSAPTAGASCPRR